MVEIVKRKVRTNGLQCPLHPTQVLTYFIFGGDIVTYYLINLVSLGHNMPLIIALGTIYGILAIGVFYYGFSSIKINPQDPTITLEKICKTNEIKFDGSNYEYHC